jgi:ribulokinase
MMPAGPFFLSLDFGTESVRAAIFDQRGKMVTSAAVAYRTYFPHSGWAEQRPDDWYHSFIQVVKMIVQNTEVDVESIIALTVDTTSCTVVALDQNFNPLRNALLWMDVRSSKQAERIARSKMDALKYNGFGSVSAEWMPPKALWIKENEPDVYAHASYLCGFQDWINYKLTGKYVGSINNATIRWYYDSRNGGFPADFYDAIGLEDIIDKFPRDILELGTPIGKIDPEVAKNTGLTHNILVVQGGADAYVGVIGLGATKPGRLAFITGSSHLMIGHAEREFHQMGIFGGFPDAIMPGFWVVEGAQISTGSILKWFKENFAGSRYEREAGEQGLSLYDYFNNLAGALPIGSEGLIVLNYWQGNRNPLTDSQARGVIWGLSLKHTPVHVYRAIMEAVSYGTEHIMRYFREAGFMPEEVYACGGATKSEFWMQMQSDVLGIPINLTEEPNAPLLGGAILASCGAGIYSSIDRAAQRMVRVRKRIEPVHERTEEYRYFVEKYIETYPPLKELMHDMLNHEWSSSR